MTDCGVNVTTNGDSTCSTFVTEGSERVLLRALTCLRRVGGQSAATRAPRLPTGNHGRTTA